MFPADCGVEIFIRKFRPIVRPFVLCGAVAAATLPPMSNAPHSPTAVLDAETVEAIQVLTDAVRRERVPGVIEFRQLERALEEAVAQGTEEHLAEAASVFHAMDGDFRTRIVARARALAQSVVEKRHAAPAEPRPPEPRSPEPPPLTAGPRPPQSPGASPFLAALNQSRPR